MAEQFSLGTINEALGRYPAHALNEAADYLAAIDAGVNRTPDVDQQIHTRHTQVTRKAIDLDLGDGGALRVVQKRISAPGFAVVVDTRRGVEPVGTKVDTLAAGRIAQFTEVDALCRIAGVEHYAI